METRSEKRAGRLPIDIPILFLLVFLNLPSEGRLEFGRELAGLAETGGFWAGIFEKSLVRNPIGALQVAACTALLFLYGFVATGDVSFRVRRRAKGAILVLLIAALLVLPAIGSMALRFQDGPRGHAHDGGVIQTEEALRFFLRGENPYAADYRSTPMAGLDWGPGNPAILHLPYFPLSFLIHLPGYAVGKAFFGGYDARATYLLLYLLPFFWIPRWTADPERRVLLAAFWGLNPFLVPHLIEGRNDVVPLVAMLGAAHLMLSGRARGAALFLGAACAAKQFAFLMIPFFVIYLGRSEDGWAGAVRAGVRRAAPLLLPVALFVLPFFLWNPGAFVDDTWLFNTGLSEVSYPLGGTPGYGLANLINVFGLVESRYHYFPFGLFQIPLMIAVGGFFSGDRGRGSARAHR